MWGDEALFQATQLHWYDMEGGREVRTMRGRGGMAALAADGRTFATLQGPDYGTGTVGAGSNSLGVAYSGKEVVRLWEVGTNRELLSGPLEKAAAAALSPDGRFLAWGSR